MCCVQAREKRDICRDNTFFVSIYEWHHHDPESKQTPRQPQARQASRAMRLVCGLAEHHQICLRLLHRQVSHFLHVK